MTQELPGVSAYDSDHAMQEVDSSDIELELELYSSYIAEQVEKLVGHHSSIGGQSMLDKDDIAQLVLIKFWQASKKKRIDHPKVYIKRMVYNEFVTILRARKLTISLSLTEEEEEIRDASAMFISCEEKEIPENQVEQKDAAACCAKRAAKAVATLAPRQRRAMECFLHEHLDDPRQFKDTFEVWNLNIEDANWPTKKAEKQLLNASLSAARTKVAKLMNFDLALYKRKGASYLVK